MVLSIQDFIYWISIERSPAGMVFTAQQRKNEMTVKTIMELADMHAYAKVTDGTPKELLPRNLLEAKVLEMTSAAKEHEDALLWLQANLHHITASRSVTGKNIRMWSSTQGGQVCASTLLGCIQKFKAGEDGGQS